MSLLSSRECDDDEGGNGRGKGGKILLKKLLQNAQVQSLLYCNDRR